MQWQCYDKQWHFLHIYMYYYLHTLHDKVLSYMQIVTTAGAMCHKAPHNIEL